ncbi:MAG: hypothetical protein AB1813_08670 [Verrucomicrobiota bacterium]
MLAIFAFGMFARPFWPLMKFTVQERLNRIPFDEQLWKQNPRSKSEWARTGKLPIRIRMVDHLLATYDFKGQTRSEVIERLGEPDQTEYFRNEWDWVYWLGPGRAGNAIGDSEWLVFRFDTAGTVGDCRIVHD